jgi:anti-anti-sigma regulatory factor
MTSQRQRPARDLPEVPYFSLDMHTCPDGDGDIVEVLLTGDVDEATVGHLEDSLAWVVGHMEQRRVVVDLSAAQHVEPCGALALRRVADALRGTGRELAVRHEPDAVRAALEATGLSIVGVDPDTEG